MPKSIGANPKHKCPAHNRRGPADDGEYGHPLLAADRPQDLLLVSEADAGPLHAWGRESAPPAEGAGAPRKRHLRRHFIG